MRVPAAPPRALSLVLVLLLCPLRATLASPPPSASDAVRALADAYSRRSLPALDSLLTADFRFHASEGDSAGTAYLDGLPRADELAGARAMFEGDARAGAPRADSIQVAPGTLDEGPDPEHADSSTTYRLVVAHGFQLRLTLGTGEHAMHVQAGDALQIFHVVRGDVALLAPGQTSDAHRWYLRRWLEDMTAVRMSLGRIEGDCGGGAAAAAAPPAAPSGRIGLRVQTAPLCPSLRLLCDLPGAGPATIEVFDVTGRRLVQRTLAATAPGTQLIEAGEGRHFDPGVYWVTLRQGARPPARRMVVVAR